MTVRIPVFMLVLAAVWALAGGLLPVGGKVAAQEKAKVITNSIGMKLGLIPAGRFMMGSPTTEAEREAEELPHEVVISKPFYLGVHEVTQQEYQAIMGKNPSLFNQSEGGGPDHPVEQVKWADAADFCKKLSARPEEKKAGRSYRLPTEAEWEYACRAGTATPFHCGPSLESKQANFNGQHPYGSTAKGPFLGRTAKVGSFPPNAWGLYDMHGNVWEWCADWYDPSYYKSSPKQDPQGPAKGVVKTGFGNDYFGVVRGGCWLEDARNCRAASRFRLQRQQGYRWAGFRVVCGVVAEK